MTIELTEEQRQAVMMGRPVRLSLPEVGGEVVLLRANREMETSQENLAKPTRLGSFLVGFGSILDMFTPPCLLTASTTDADKLEGDWARIASDLQAAQLRWDVASPPSIP